MSLFIFVSEALSAASLLPVNAFPVPVGRTLTFVDDICACGMVIVNERIYLLLFTCCVVALSSYQLLCSGLLWVTVSACRSIFVVQHSANIHENNRRLFERKVTSLFLETSRCCEYITFLRLVPDALQTCIDCSQRHVYFLSLFRRREVLCNFCYKKLSH